MASACAIASLTACGGSSFTAAPGDAGASDGATSDAADAGEAGAGDGGTDAGGNLGNGAPVPCGSVTCSGMEPVCCAGDTQSCAHVQCGCTTQLDCASDAQCAGGTICCVRNRMDLSCTTGHWVSKCEPSCLGGDQLCDPNAQGPQCGVGKSCSTDQTALQNVGLPSGAGFGVCTL